MPTQEAAALLGISRPTLVRLLEDGEIPHMQSDGTPAFCSLIHSRTYLCDAMLRLSRLAGLSEAC